MSIKKKRLEPGAYVQIKDGTHDPMMPENRRDGLVVEISGRRRDRITVLFSNGAFLTFHKSYVDVLSKIH